MGINGLWKVIDLHYSMLGSSCALRPQRPKLIMIFSQILESSSEKTTLKDVLNEHILKNRDGEIGYVLGVDARYATVLYQTTKLLTGYSISIWLVSSQFASRHCHAQAGENPELRTLFHRLSRFAAHPVSVVFVFDGPRRPTTKRQTCVVPKAHFLTSGFQELIEAFGFIYHEV